MNLNIGFNREIFGYIRNNTEEKGLEKIPPEMIDNIDNDPDMILITEAGLNPFSGTEIGSEENAGDDEKIISEEAEAV